MNNEEIQGVVDHILQKKVIDPTTKEKVLKYSCAGILLKSVDIDKERGFTSVILVDQTGKEKVGYAKRHLSEDKHNEILGVSYAIKDSIRRFCGIKRRIN